METRQIRVVQGRYGVLLGKRIRTYRILDDNIGGGRKIIKLDD